MTPFHFFIYNKSVVIKFLKSDLMKNLIIRIVSIVLSVIFIGLFILAYNLDGPTRVDSYAMLFYINYELNIF